MMHAFRCTAVSGPTLPPTGVQRQRPESGSGVAPPLHEQVPSGLQLPCSDERAGSRLQVWSIPGTHGLVDHHLIDRHPDRPLVPRGVRARLHVEAEGDPGARGRGERLEEELAGEGGVVGALEAAQLVGLAAHREHPARRDAGEVNHRRRRRVGEARHLQRHRHRVARGAGAGEAQHRAGRAARADVREERVDASDLDRRAVDDQRGRGRDQAPRGPPRRPAGRSGRAPRPGRGRGPGHRPAPRR